MYLKIQKINSRILKESEEYFWWDFCDKLKKQKPWTYVESLVARYLIEKNNQRAKTLCWQIELYLSISHKKDLVFIWTSKNNIWVDIEILKERDINLLDKFREEEYSLLWWKNWKNFYILWTAKESIIKYLNLLLDNIEDIILIRSITNKQFISDLEFVHNLELQYKWDKLKVFSGEDSENIFSVCF